MPQKIYEVTAPNGKVFEVEGDRPPTEAELDDIFAKMGGASSQIEAPPAPAPSTRWADRMGLNEPTTSRLKGFARGSGAAAVDMAQGVTSGAMRQLKSMVAGLAQGGYADAGINASAEEDLGDALIPDTPPTVAGRVGEAIPIAAELAMGGGKAIGAIPRAARAGKKFQEVMSVAGDMPVSVARPASVGLRIMELEQRGSTMPKAVKKFMARINEAGGGQVTYREARDFASNLSRLSVKKSVRADPVMLREVATMAAELNQSIASTAKQAGKLDEFQSAMKEYSRAMRLRNAAGVALKAGAAGAVGALGMKVLGEL